jgi:ribosomal protein S25
MENKKLGVILVLIALVVGSVLFYYNSQLIEQSQEMGCFANVDCLPLEKGLSVSHFAIGIFSFILALGAYLLFFNKTEEAILKKLEDEKNQKIEDMKFGILLRALDSFERKVVSVVRDQPGITQSTLRLKTDMSKAKLSYVLQDLEKKGIVKRVSKGKSLSVYLKI